MKSKKFLAGLLAAAMALSLTACGGGDSSTPDASGNTSTSGSSQAAAMRFRQSRSSRGASLYTPWAVPMATASASQPLPPAQAAASSGRV